MDHVMHDGEGFDHAPRPRRNVLELHRLAGVTDLARGMLYGAA
jgi:hypothetical protein